MPYEHLGRKLITAELFSVALILWILLVGMLIISFLLMYCVLYVLLILFPYDFIWSLRKY